MYFQSWYSDMQSPSNEVPHFEKHEDNPEQEKS